MFNHSNRHPSESREKDIAEHRISRPKECSNSSGRKKTTAATAAFFRESNYSHYICRGGTLKMIINLFKTNQISGIVFLILFQVLVFLSAAFHEVPGLYNKGDTILYNTLFESWAYIKWLNLGLSFILVFTQAMIYNYLVIQLNLLGKTTYLPAFFYLLIACMLPGNLLFNSGIVAASFIVPAVYILMTAPADKKPLRTVFNISILFSIASLFYLEALFYFPFVLIAMAMLGLLTFRSTLVSFIGFLTPYIYVLSWYFWIDDLPGYWERQFTGLIRLIPQSFPFQVTELVLYGLIILLLGLSLFRYVKTRFTLKVIQRKIYNVFTLFFITSFLVPLFFKEAHKQQIVLLAIPMGVYLSFYFLNLKRQWIADVFTLMLFITIAVLQIEFY